MTTTTRHTTMARTWDASDLILECSCGWAQILPRDDWLTRRAQEEEAAHLEADHTGAQLVIVADDWTPRPWMFIAVAMTIVVVALLILASR